MRLDVFLKTSRLVKRRSQAKELCDDDAVKINQRPVRASREVVAGDRLELTFWNRRLVVEVDHVPERPPRAREAHELYRVLADERIEVDDSAEARDATAGDPG